jgi:HlyD family secretion protein
MRRNQIFLLAWIGIPFLTTCGMIDGQEHRVHQGPFKATLTETGELQAANLRVISMPSFDWEYGRPKIVSLEKEGTIVEKGQWVGQVDTTGVTRVLGQKKADLEIAIADLNKLLVEQQTELENLGADLSSAEAAYKLAIIDTQRVRFESLSKQRISKLELQNALITLQKVQQKIESTKKIHQEAVLIEREKIKQIKSSISKAEWTIDNFTLKAPADGMIEYRRRRWGDREKLKVGGEYWPGEGLIGLPDLSRMKVLTMVNERDIEKIHLDQKVFVRLDAYPKVTFEGKIIRISRTCRKKERDSKIIVFDVEVMLDKADPILRPGMTVSAEIMVSELEDVLYVDLECVQEDENGYYLLIKKGSAAKRVDVRLGPRNARSVVVYGSVKAGDKIELPEKEGEA